MAGNPYYDDEDSSAFGSGGDDPDAWGGFGSEDLSRPPEPMALPPYRPAPPPPVHTPQAAPRPAAVEEVPDWAVTRSDRPDDDDWDTTSGFTPAPVARAPQPVAAAAPAAAPQAKQSRFPQRPPKAGPGTPQTKASLFPARPSKPAGSAPTGASKRAGGRWQRTLFRGLTYTVLGFALIIGLKAMFFPRVPPTADETAKLVAAKLGSTGFPIEQGNAVALRYATAYLTYSQNTSDTRKTELDALSSKSDTTGYGWNGQGSQSLSVPAFVAGKPELDGENRAVITVGARNDRGLWLYLAVPLFAEKADKVSVAGEPAYIAPPRKANPPPLLPVTLDRAAGDQLATVLPGFFKAWAASDLATLNQYVIAGADVGGLQGAVTLNAVDLIAAPVGGNERVALVTVSWVSGGPVVGADNGKTGTPPSGTSPSGSLDPASKPATLSQAYRVGVTYKPDVQKWYVNAITGGRPAGGSATAGPAGGTPPASPAG